MADEKRPMTEHERLTVKLCDVILERVAHDEQGAANPDVLLAAIHVHRIELEVMRKVLFGEAFGAYERPSRAQLERAYETLFEKRVLEECERYRLPVILRAPN